MRLKSPKFLSPRLNLLSNDIETATRSKGKVEKEFLWQMMKKWRGLTLIPTLRPIPHQYKDLLSLYLSIHYSLNSLLFLLPSPSYYCFVNSPPFPLGISAFGLDLFILFIFKRSIQSLSIIYQFVPTLINPPTLQSHLH